MYISSFRLSCSCLLRKTFVQIIVFSLVIFSPVSAFAVDPQGNENIIQLRGLSFLCQGCQIEEQDESRSICQMVLVLHNQSWLMSCDEGLTSLLQELSRGQYDFEHPSSSELQIFLRDALEIHESSALHNITEQNHLATEQNKQVGMIIGLLSQNEKGRYVLINHAKRLAHYFQPVVEKLLEDQKNIHSQGMIKLRRAFWELPSSGNRARDLRLRTIVAAGDPELSLRDILDEVSVHSTEEALSELQLVEKTLEEKNERWISEIHEIIQALRECESSNQESIREKNDLPTCDTQYLRIQEAREFIQRLYKKQQISQLPLSLSTGNQKQTTWAFFLLSCLAILGLIIWRKRMTRLAKQIDLESSGLSYVEQEELCRLLQSFQLSPIVEEVQLTQAFRQYVKEHHPDVGGNSCDKFIKISQNYQRARTLFAKRGTRL